MTTYREFNICLMLVHVVPVKNINLNNYFIRLNFLKTLADGFFADRDDCRKFHVCYGGTQSVRWCKDGMLWDETKIGCSLQSITPCIGGRKKWTYDQGIYFLLNT